LTSILSFDCLLCVRLLLVGYTYTFINESTAASVAAATTTTTTVAAATAK
jgi:hypothetical protein